MKKGGGRENEYKSLRFDKKWRFVGLIIACGRSCEANDCPRLSGFSMFPN